MLGDEESLLDRLSGMVADKFAYLVPLRLIRRPKSLTISDYRPTFRGEVPIFNAYAREGQIATAISGFFFEKLSYLRRAVRLDRCNVEKDPIFGVESYKTTRELNTIWA